MAIDGKWEITINSPMGAQKASLDLKSDGAGLSGTQTAQGSTQALANGKVDGNKLACSHLPISARPNMKSRVACEQNHRKSIGKSRRLGCWVCKWLWKTWRPHYYRHHTIEKAVHGSFVPMSE